MGQIIINGKSYSGNNISIQNGLITIDGSTITDKDLPKAILSIEIKGTINNLDTDASVNCGDVAGSINAGGSVNCDNVRGDVRAGGSVSCDNVSGNIYAGGSVSS